MDKTEAKSVLADELDRQRRSSYQELTARIPKKTKKILFIERVDKPQVETHKVEGASGTTYQVETQVFWDGTAGEDVRVVVSVDDGGWRAFSPLSDDFIMAPDGTFVGG